MVEVVGVARQQQSLDPTRAPVAIKDSEEDLGMAPLAVEVGLRDPKTVAARVIPVWVESEPIVIRRVRHGESMTELQLKRQAGVAEQAIRAVRPERDPTPLFERVSDHVSRGRDPDVGVHAILGSPDPRAELLKQQSDRREAGVVHRKGVDGFERLD